MVPHIRVPNAKGTPLSPLGSKCPSPCLCGTEGSPISPVLRGPQCHHGTTEQGEAFISPPRYPSAKGTSVSLPGYRRAPMRVCAMSMILCPRGSHVHVPMSSSPMQKGFWCPFLGTEGTPVPTSLQPRAPPGVRIPTSPAQRGPHRHLRGTEGPPTAFRGFVPLPHSPQPSPSSSSTSRMVPIPPPDPNTRSMRFSRSHTQRPR